MRLDTQLSTDEEILLPQYVSGWEKICGGFEYHILCMTAVVIPLDLKTLIGVPAELQIVTDRGQLRSVCGIVTEASVGCVDGGLGSYQLVLRDALAVMERRANTRVFKDKSEVDIVEILVNEWRLNNAVLAPAFDYEIDLALRARPFPVRPFTMQCNESDAAFIRRLLKRRGISWVFRPGLPLRRIGLGEAGTCPAHTLRLFDGAHELPENAAGSVYCQREDAVAYEGQRDTITEWRGLRTLQPSRSGRFSWRYSRADWLSGLASDAPSQADQGRTGKRLAVVLDDYQTDSPDADLDRHDHLSLAQRAMRKHELDAKCFHGVATVRDFCAGESFQLAGNSDIGEPPRGHNRFAIMSIDVSASNNLAPGMATRLARVFSRNGWRLPGSDEETALRGPQCYRVSFTCVRSNIPIMPGYDPRTDLPQPRLQSALVVGPPGEAVCCTELGEVYVRFIATRPADHAHAGGKGAGDNQFDSAPVRIAMGLAANGPLRTGSEVLVDFINGDPDRPVIIGMLNNNSTPPPAFSGIGSLPGNRYLHGWRSREVRGERGNQLRLDDTAGQISAQLASDHAATQLNLGYLTTPRRDGNGTARGEGAELRSDKALALRGGQGVLISAAVQRDAGGAQLERQELVGLADVLQGIVQQLSSLAATHAGDAADGAQLAALVDRVKAWELGSNVASAGLPDKQALVAVTAPAGIVVASQDNLLLGAETRVDVISASDTHLAAGKNLLLRAVRGITLFGYQLGIKLIAATGNIVVQTHQGDVLITASGRIRLASAKGIDLEAPEINLVAQGARVSYSGGAVTHQCSGAYAIKSASFAHVKPGGATPANVFFPVSTMKTDERVVLSDRQTGLPLPQQAYTATLEDGSAVSGVTDELGHTDIVKHADIGQVLFEFDERKQ